MSITLIIIIITCLVSYSALNNGKIMDDLIFYPPYISGRKQWYRFFTSGFIHADYAHLIFNMLSLYFFGPRLERNFSLIFQEKGPVLYILMYVLALGVCLLPTYTKNKSNYNYSSLGASGAVSAVIFAAILLSPLDRLGLMLIPIHIPGFIFGPVFLLVSYYLDKQQGGNINHSAHIWGALFGVAFLIVAGQLFSDAHILAEFIEQIRSFNGRLFS